MKHIDTLETSDRKIDTVIDGEIDTVIDGETDRPMALGEIGIRWNRL